MGLASLKDLYLDELADLYAAESQVIRALPRLVEAARAPHLRESLAKHCDESRLHLERLQLIFTHWGEPLPSGICAGVAGIVRDADDRLNQLATHDVRDAVIIGVAQRLGHYEIAAYGCGRRYAHRLGRPDEARLLKETLDEELRNDRRLTEITEGHGKGDRRPDAHLTEGSTTVPPKRAKRSTRNPRSFANEFPHPGERTDEPTSSAHEELPAGSTTAPHRDELS